MQVFTPASKNGPNVRHFFRSSNRQLQIYSYTPVKQCWTVNWWSIRYWRNKSPLKQIHQRLVYRCLRGMAPSYLADSYFRVADVESRQRLRSASTDELIIPSMRLSTVGDRAFHVAAARTWNSLPLHVTSAPSLPIVQRQLKTALFTRSYPDCAARV